MLQHMEVTSGIVIGISTRNFGNDLYTTYPTGLAIDSCFGLEIAVSGLPCHWNYCKKLKHCLILEQCIASWVCFLSASNCLAWLYSIVAVLSTLVVLCSDSSDMLLYQVQIA